MRRLYLQIYLGFIAILVLFTLLAGFAWWHAPQAPGERRAFEGVAATIDEILPAPDRPRGELEAALSRLAERFDADLSVFDRDGALLAAVGPPVRRPQGDRPRSGFLGRRGPGPTVSLRLSGDRWLLARFRHRHDPAGWLVGLGLLAVATAIGAYPVVRRVTRRLERLRARVDQLGSGELGARVDVEGKDEVADLARSFNRAAERIQRLVESQRTLLASASHELRSPLARMRVAIELLAADERPELRDRVSKDIAELDELIGELLLASRLDSVDLLERPEEVDLLALVVEEGARVDARVDGEPVSIRADARMLRRLVRNLFENARRYGNASPIEATVERTAEGGARVRVCDRGPGVPEAERERIFEPFYRPLGTRETGEGVGLGLALVRQIARHHGGEARCLPRDGGGTCFEVDL